VIVLLTHDVGLESDNGQTTPAKPDPSTLQGGPRR